MSLHWLEERAAQYTDDLLLFLNDPGLSLQGTLLEVAVLPSLEALQSLPYRGAKAPFSLMPSMFTTLKVWRVSISLESHTPLQLSEHSPLAESHFTSLLRQ